MKHLGGSAERGHHLIIWISLITRVSQLISHQHACTDLVDDALRDDVVPVLDERHHGVHHWRVVESVGHVDRVA